MLDQTDFVFLPGFMCDDRLFAAVSQALSRAGQTCLSGDLSSHDTIKALATATLDISPRSFALVGLSMGGIVALEMHRQAPERISHLALLNTTYRADRAGPTRLKQLERVRQGELDLVLRDELKPNYMHPDNRSQERLDLLARMAGTLGEEVFERQTRALMQRENYADQLGRIDCPTLVLTGADDEVCPPEVHCEMAKRISGSELQIVPQCGHLSALEQPDAVTSALLALVGSQVCSDTPLPQTQTA
ncbi:alpha/beta fold hydrolase [Erythrobacter sp. MTPC3]|uniref:alpha/beta fold hydrolase n=1 Tax=Erythrobacter sp. MTPC3 TaxID=3056564 RepID=UPI0036F3950E